MTVTATPAPGPTAPAARALGPDLARGWMLLFIALANSHYFLPAPSVRGGFPQDGSTLDSVVAWLIATVADGRAFPMFGVLFGYGVARIVARQEPRGPKGVRRLLWRRSLVLVGVGVLHALLLYAGDILAAYGVLLAVCAWTVRWRDRWVLLVAGLFFLLTALPGEGSLVVATTGPDAAALPPDLGTMLAERPAVSAFVSVLGPLGFLCPFMVGLLAGRRGILEQPGRHRTLLRATALTGIAAAWLGAQPAALLLAGVGSPPDTPTLQLYGALHDATGVLGGFGYAALLALAAGRLDARHGRVVRAIAATGQRSMTSYVSQSVVWAVVFTPFLLDLSGRLTTVSTALLAAATWIATVVAADWMRRHGERGPLERLTRRVTYGCR